MSGLFGAALILLALAAADLAGWRRGPWAAVTTASNSGRPGRYR